MEFSPKDFVRAGEDLWFAVLTGQPEDARVLGSLRYARNRQGRWQKTDSRRAESVLKRVAPHYLYHSSMLDARVHGVPIREIEEVVRPRIAGEQLLAEPDPDAVQRAAIKSIKLLHRAGVPPEVLGVTGSVMLGLQGPRSDVDLVIYGRTQFNAARTLVAGLLESADVTPLNNIMWREAHARRDCALDFPDYLRHEERKRNKFSVNGVKVDLSMVLAPGDDQPDAWAPYRKVGRREINATVTDDRYAFDLPARYPIEHEDIREIVACTHTYAGQALSGERVTASGIVEIDSRGQRRLVVGTSREARGEYLRVVEWRG